MGCVHPSGMNDTEKKVSAARKPRPQYPGTAKVIRGGPQPKAEAGGPAPLEQRNGDLFTFLLHFSGRMWWGGV